MSTGQNIVDRVRVTTQDQDSDSYRVSDAQMLRFLNDGLKEAAILRPDLFTQIGDIPLADDTALQSAPAGALILVDIFSIKAGAAVIEARRSDLDGFDRSWYQSTPGAAENWARHPKQPTQFFVYPRSTGSQILTGQWSAPPSDLATLNESLPSDFSPAYDTALHHYIVFRVEAMDDEHVMSGRAQLFSAAFSTLLGVGVQTKQAMETKQ